MSKLIVLVGLPGSGKSEYAKMLEKEGYIICSSDQMREELFGDEKDQDHNAEVFQKLHEKIYNLLRGGYDVVYDACNINSKRRKQYLDSLRGINCIKEAHVIATPYDMVLEQNANRDRVVPKEVIDRMYKNWQTPSEWEGFNTVELIQQIPGEDYNIENYDHYDQNNPHHQFTLGQHMRNVADYIKLKTDNYLLYEAAIRHDSGKPFCEFKDESGISHYYGHENVGAYDVLNEWGLGDDEALEISRLINYHMRPISWRSKGSEAYKKTCNKHKDLWGEDFFNSVMLLHEADIAEH